MTATAESARTITADLMARLQRHYIKPGEPLPGGVFLPEVGSNGGHTSRRCDALYVGFTSSSGRLLVGHEVKASRADWLKELDTVGKADAWADQCHAWWLVTVPGVVLDGELPAGWGLMVPGTSKTRMKVLQPAVVHRERAPSWEVCRSLLARQDTLRAQVIADARQKARDEAHAGVDQEVERRLAQRSHDHDTLQRLRDRLARIEEALGVQITDDDVTPWQDGVVNLTELRRAIDFVRSGRDLDRALDATRHRHLDPARRLRTLADEVEKALNGLRAGDLGQERAS